MACIWAMKSHQEHNCSNEQRGELYKKAPKCTDMLKHVLYSPYVQKSCQDTPMESIEPITVQFP